MKIQLPWLPSANRIWITNRMGRTYLSGKYKNLLREAQILWLEQGRPRVSGEVAVHLYLFPPDRRSVDVDNRIKPTLDTLTKIGFWADDEIVKHVRATLCGPVQDGAIIAEVYRFDALRVPAAERYGLKRKKSGERKTKR